MSPVRARILSAPNALTFAGLLLIAFSATDPMSWPHVSGRLLWIRLAWGLSLVACGQLARRAGAAGRSRVCLFVGTSTPIFFGLFLLQCGGAQNGSFPWFLAIPLAMVALLQSAPSRAAVGALSSLGVAVALLVHAGTPAAVVLQWAFSLAASGVLAVYAAWNHHRLRAEADRQNQGRMEALSRLVESERRRAASERMALVGQLASGVAHEVNNPLAIIRSNLEYLREELKGPPGGEADTVIDESLHGALRIGTIVQSLEHFARESSDEVAPVALRPLIDEAVELAALRFGPAARLTVELPQELGPVAANAAELVETLVGVLANAADALGQSSSGTVWLRGRAEGEHVVLTVEDDGPGFSPDALQRAGTPFFTNKAPGRGTGLGLAVGKEKLQRVGGALAFGNRDEGGARVTLTLRRARPDELRAPAPDASQPAPAPASKLQLAG